MATKFELRIQEQEQIAKVNKIVKAYDKVKEKLESFNIWAEVNFHSVFDRITEEKRDELREVINGFRWNEWHDLESRLENRYNDAVSKLNEIRFELNGFVAF